MKKLLLTLILMVVMTVPAMAFDINKDFKLQGDLNVGYVVSDSFETDVNGTVMDTTEAGSKIGYMADIKLVYKDQFRPWIYLQGISGYSTANSWEIATQTFGIGLDYFFYTTKFGTAYARMSYTNWKTKVDAQFMGMDISAKPNSDTWMMSLGWSF